MYFSVRLLFILYFISISGYQSLLRVFSLFLLDSRVSLVYFFFDFEIAFGLVPIYFPGNLKTSLTDILFSSISKALYAVFSIYSYWKKLSYAFLVLFSNYNLSLSILSEFHFSVGKTFCGIEDFFYYFFLLDPWVVPLPPQQRYSSPFLG